MTASLMGTLGDLDLVEDVLQEAFITALERWPQMGIPPNPVGCDAIRPLRQKKQ
ncbi:hypothetical protein KFU94_22670 [Chloroflexi bacterium TSY]|nr:hypothetical protein [Chloroflexi bacterium TSY]